MSDNSANSKDPSMEDILASIRRIIDDEGDDVVQRSPAPKPAAKERSEIDWQSLDSLIGGQAEEQQDAAQSDMPEEPQDAAQSQEPEEAQGAPQSDIPEDMKSTEEAVFDLVERDEAEDDSDPFAALVNASEERETDDVLNLTQRLNDDGTLTDTSDEMDDEDDAIETIFADAPMSEFSGIADESADASRGINAENEAKAPDALAPPAEGEPQAPDEHAPTLAGDEASEPASLPEPPLLEPSGGETEDMGADNPFNSADADDPIVPPSEPEDIGSTDVTASESSPEMDEGEPSPLVPSYANAEAAAMPSDNAQGDAHAQIDEDELGGLEPGNLVDDPRQDARPIMTDQGEKVLDDPRLDEMQADGDANAPDAEQALADPRAEPSLLVTESVPEETRDVLTDRRQAPDALTHPASALVDMQADRSGSPAADLDSAETVDETETRFAEAESAFDETLEQDETSDEAEERYTDEPPAMDDDYSASLGLAADPNAFLGDPVEPPHESAKSFDEIDAVGGMVRDALGREPESPTVEPMLKEEDAGLLSSAGVDSSAMALAQLAEGEEAVARRLYGQLRLSETAGAETVEGMVRDMLRPMLREWLEDNLPNVVENMVRGEVERISARSRNFVKTARKPD